MHGNWCSLFLQGLSHVLVCHCSPGLSFPSLKFQELDFMFFELKLQLCMLSLLAQSFDCKERRKVVNYFAELCYIWCVFFVGSVDLANSAWHLW